MDVQREAVGSPASECADTRPLASALVEVARRWADAQFRLVMLAAEFADSAEWVLESPTTRQKRFVKERDRTCRDCGSRELLEYDHNPAHAKTGHTLTNELELRCAPCHHRRHRGRPSSSVVGEP